MYLICNLNSSCKKNLKSVLTLKFNSTLTVLYCATNLSFIIKNCTSHK